MTEIPYLDRITQLENSLNETHRQRALAEQIWRQDNAALAAEVEKLREVARAAMIWARHPDRRLARHLTKEGRALMEAVDALAKRGEEGK